MERSMLRIGAKNSQVGELKRLLKALSYGVGDTTDDFDMRTCSAVEAFQNDYSLMIDGVVDNRTWAALERAYARVAPEQVPETVDAKAHDEPIQTVDSNVQAPDAALDLDVQNTSVEGADGNMPQQGDTSNFMGLPNLQEGSEGEYVKELQWALYGLGFYTGELDGIFGPETKASLEAFQKENGLTPDGTVCRAVWEKLYTELHEHRDELIHPTLGPESKGSHVRELKIKMALLGFYRGVINGIYDELVHDAVIRFQKQFGLEPDGIVGPATWKAINNTLDLPNVLVNAIKRPTLSKGAVGVEVRHLQNLLKAMGLYTAEVDGRFGPATAAAVRKFQADVGLPANGIVDAQTWAAIERVCGEEVVHEEMNETPVDMEPVDNAPLEAAPLAAGDPPTLRQGDTGAYVAQLQSTLNALGYSTGGVDGKFGPATAAAVRAFQSAYGLTPDGIVGPRTWDALEKASAPTPPAPPSTQRPTLREGDKGAYVTQLQQLLKEVGYYAGVVDGVFGPATTAAVKAFQKAAGLTQDGVVGPRTWAALEKASSTPTPEERPILRLGAQGIYVVKLQERLIQLGYLPGPPDGIFGTVTDAAVRKFQKDAGLVADGVVGPQTWTALDRGGVTPGPGPGPSPRPVLREGDTGAYVSQLQQQLKNLGYYPGTVDGKFGPATTVAVKAFQTDYGLPNDGVVGPKTWEALDKAELPPPAGFPELREGDTGEYVTILQDKLKAAGYFPGTVTGSFGPETTDAVRIFQRNNGLLADGIVGPETWQAIYSAAPKPPTPDGGGGGGIAAKPTLRYGDTGPFVEELQRELSLLMFYNGPINGKFDNATLVAVKAFQDVNYLTPDGIVGKVTWYALESLYPPPVKC